MNQQDFIIASTKYPSISFSFNTILNKRKNLDKIERYIINKFATIIFWSDGTKTISKRHLDDTFDKELGFLFAFFYKCWGGSKASVKRIINSINYDNAKIFLFEFFIRENNMSIEDGKKYLKNLKVSE